MKKTNLKPIHDMNSTTPMRAQRNSVMSARAAAPLTFKLGLDVDLRQVVVATQCERGVIPLAQKLTRAQLLAWVQEQVRAGHAVHTVYECCGFGYTLHEELVAAGTRDRGTIDLKKRD